LAEFTDLHPNYVERGERNIALENIVAQQKPLNAHQRSLGLNEGSVNINTKN